MGSKMWVNSEWDCVGLPLRGGQGPLVKRLARLVNRSSEHPFQSLLKEALSSQALALLQSKCLTFSAVAHIRPVKVVFCQPSCPCTPYCSHGLIPVRNWKVRASTSARCVGPLGLHLGGARPHVPAVSSYAPIWLEPTPSLGFMHSPMHSASTPITWPPGLLTLGSPKEQSRAKAGQDERSLSEMGPENRTTLGKEGGTQSGNQPGLASSPAWALPHKETVGK